MYVYLYQLSSFWLWNTFIKDYKMLRKKHSKYLFCFVLFCFVLFCFVLFCFVLFCFVLFCFVLFCFVLFCFVLFCFVLFCLSRSRITPFIHIPDKLSPLSPRCQVVVQLMSSKICSNCLVQDLLGINLCWFGLINMPHQVISYFHQCTMF